MSDVASSLDVHPTSRQLRDALGEALTRGDDERGAPLLAYLDGGGHLLGRVDDLVRDRDDRQGWVWLLDPDETLEDWLRWLAQFRGVRLRGELTATQQRNRIKETSGQQRGTVSALKGAARQLLSDTRLVRVDERRLPDHTRDPYHVVVTTYEPETADPDAVERLVRDEKPAGLVLHYQVGQFATLGDIEAVFTSLAEVDDYFPSLEMIRTYVIGEREHA